MWYSNEMAKVLCNGNQYSVGRQKKDHLQMKERRGLNKFILLSNMHAVYKNSIHLTRSIVKTLIR